MAYKIKSKKVKEKKTFVVEQGSEYDKQANKFLKETNTTFKIRFVKHDKYFPDDKESRDIYRFTLMKNGKTYSGTFGQSIAGSEKKEIPSAYSVLSSLGADRFEGSFQEFAGEYGYDEDSMNAYKTYKAVQKQNEGMKNLYSEQELDNLSEIQ
ncbi:MAG TPA: hypothetical protein VMZ91_13505 [Candidatus Paceibacterota bacterium]|nr:hypothetical protein [Candidatus Paceibacterota bacterium]